MSDSLGLTNREYTATDLNNAATGICGFNDTTLNRPYPFGLCFTFTAVGYKIQIAFPMSGDNTITSMSFPTNIYEIGWQEWNVLS